MGYERVRDLEVKLDSAIISTTKERIGASSNIKLVYCVFC